MTKISKVYAFSYILSKFFRFDCCEVVAVLRTAGKRGNTLTASEPVLRTGHTPLTCGRH